MRKLHLKYWLPRVAVIGFVLSLAMPAPRTIAGMDENQFLLWAARLIWVVSLPSAFCILMVVVVLIQKQLQRSRNEMPAKSDGPAD
jgi:hypothetical protein